MLRDGAGERVGGSASRRGGGLCWSARDAAGATRWMRTEDERAAAAAEESDEPRR